MKLTFYSDPGHGWLAVPIENVINSKIKVSEYSYINSTHYFLEEDCDAPEYLDYLKKNGISYSIVEEYLDNCFIRNLRRVKG